jgi:flagellar basal-body rod protein FlgF
LLFLRNKRSNMYKGMYIAVSGAVLMQTQMDTITQNLANANTAGYKKDTLAFKDYLVQPDAGIEPDGRDMSDYSGSKIDQSSGTTVSTGNKLDIALEGDGFIALDGNRYTRRGDLKKDSNGYLTNHDGIKVMGTGGPIQLPADSVEVNIDLGGKVSVVQAGNTQPTQIDTIQIMNFGPDANMGKAGDGMYTFSGEGTPSTATIKQGYIETSNVDPIKEMVQMIETQREFESYQKAIQMFNSATEKVTSQLGSL